MTAPQVPFEGVEQAETACCEGWYGAGDNYETCGRPGATYARMGCVHEHIDDLYVCAVCEQRGIFCADCFNLGHDCPMRVERTANV